jgi:hypothetical protein
MPIIDPMRGGSIWGVRRLGKHFLSSRASFEKVSLVLFRYEENVHLGNRSLGRGLLSEVTPRPYVCMEQELIQRFY